MTASNLSQVIYISLDINIFQFLKQYFMPWKLGVEDFLRANGANALLQCETSAWTPSMERRAIFVKTAVVQAGYAIVYIYISVLNFLLFFLSIQVPHFLYRVEPSFGVECITTCFKSDFR